MGHVLKGLLPCDEERSQKPTSVGHLPPLAAAMIPCAAMRFSRRSQRLSESSTARMMARASELKAQGKDIIDLSAGQPDVPSPGVAVGAAKAALDDGFTRYTASSGTPDLRRAITDRYHSLHGAPWQMSNAVITVGAKAALFQLMQTLLEDGDTAILPTPSWVSFSEQIRFAGGQPIEVAMSHDDGFRLRAQPLIEAIRPDTRLMLINSPSNPTGGCMDESDLRSLVEACAAQDIVLVSDETYEHFVYDGRRHASAAVYSADFPETVVVVSSFSKTFSMTGWRVGWAVGPLALMQKIDALQSHMTSNVTSFAMEGALAAWRHGQTDVESMIELFERRRRLTVTALNRLPGFSCRAPRGAFYAFPDISNCFSEGRHGSVAWAEFLLEEAGVACVPGAAFGNDHHLRFSFASNEEDLKQAFDRIERILST